MKIFGEIGRNLYLTYTFQLSFHFPGSFQSVKRIPNFVEFVPNPIFLKPNIGFYNSETWTHI